jgi:hypothetical protein
MSICELTACVPGGICGPVTAPFNAAVKQPTTRFPCRRIGGGQGPGHATRDDLPRVANKPRFRSLGSLDEIFRMSTVQPRDGYPAVFTFLKHLVRPRHTSRMPPLPSPVKVVPTYHMVIHRCGYRVPHFCPVAYPFAGHSRSGSRQSNSHLFSLRCVLPTRPDIAPIKRSRSVPTR